MEHLMARPKTTSPEDARREALETALATIERRYGQGSVMRLSDTSHQVVPVIPTGSIGLDLALGVGGIPRGRVTEIFGPESSGKTTQALHIIAEAQKRGGVAAFIDAEHALDINYARRLGVKTEDLLISQPDYGEQALEIADMLVRSGAVDVVVVDSVAALIPQAELEGSMGETQVGSQARLMSHAMRKLTGTIHKSRTSIVFINQLRMKIGMTGYGSPETTTGGNALKFYASVRLDLRRIQTLKDKEEVYAQLTHILLQRFGLNRVVIFEMDHDSSSLLVVLDSVPDSPLCKDEVLTNPETCRCKRMAEEVTSFDNPKLCLHFNADLDLDVRCCLPIVMSGQVRAVLSFLAPKSKWEKLRPMVPIIRKYLEVAAPVLNSLRLLDITREQSLRDPLTLCNNRRFLDEFIARYEALAKREAQCTGFLMVDLDFFKQVNDKYGHQAGDAVLRQVGRILQTTVRKSDLLIRYGGEEFLVLLINIQSDTLTTIAEKIREAVELHEFILPDGVLIKKTVSIGTSEYPADADVFYKAIKFADVALYEAKRRGRNQVASFTPELWDKDEY